MAFELRGFLTGIALELSVNPLFLDTGKKIVAYSYNGTVLPKLPEWDREMYPYAVIALSSVGDYWLYFCRTKYYATSSGGVNTDLDALPDYNLMVYALSGDGKEWVYYTSRFLTSSHTTPPVIWANADIYYRDDYSDETLAGSIYLATSEPVPVYE